MQSEVKQGLAEQLFWASLFDPMDGKTGAPCHGCENDTDFNTEVEVFIGGSAKYFCTADCLTKWLGWLPKSLWADVLVSRV